MSPPKAKPNVKSERISVWLSNKESERFKAACDHRQKQFPGQAEDYRPSVAGRRAVMKWVEAIEVFYKGEDDE